MKKRNITLLVLLFMSAASFAFLLPAPNNIALFLIIKNNVDRKPENANWTKAKKGELIYGGDFVRTQKQSFTLIKFNDNSALRLGPNAEVQVFGDRDPSSVNISSGDVDFKMTKRKEGVFRFTTPTSVASIRGTQGLIGVNLDGSDFLTIIEGLVMFTNKVSNVVDSVGAGYTAISYKDGTITVHKSTQQDIDRLNQLVKEFTGQQHKIEIWFMGSDGKLHKMTIQTGQ